MANAESSTRFVNKSALPHDLERTRAAAVFGLGDHLVSAAVHTAPLEVLLLGGLPIGAPIAHYGPFVMNTRDEILQAIDDDERVRLGTISADQLAPRNFG